MKYGTKVCMKCGHLKHEGIAGSIGVVGWINYDHGGEHLNCPPVEPKPNWTPGPWFVSGVRFRMNGSDWHSINRYNEETKKDDNIAVVGFDPRTGAGFADARLISAAPELHWILAAIIRDLPHRRDWLDPNLEKMARDVLAKAEGGE